MAAVDIPGYVLWLVWTLIGFGPQVKRIGSSVDTIESDEQLEELVEDTGLIFPDGIDDVLQSSTPPSIAWFKSLPETLPSATTWAMYLVVLEKPSHKPHIYVGSATHQFHGVAGRWKEYDNEVVLPSRVKELLNDGYSITKKGLLCWSPRPSAANLFTVRDLFLKFETTFSLVFWAMRDKDNDYRMPRLCPWPLESLAYDGCCSHVAWAEGLREGAARGLAGEDLEAYYDPMRYYCGFCETLFRYQPFLDRHKETKKHILNATLAAAAEVSEDDPQLQAAIRQGKDDRRKFKLIISAAKKLAKNLATKRYNCDVCDKSFSTQFLLDRHCRSATHVEKVVASGSLADDPQLTDLIREAAADRARQTAESKQRREGWIASKRYYCDCCELSCASSTDLNNHKKTAGHKRRAALAAAGRLKPKKYHCKVCDKKFTLESSLRRHRLTPSHKKRAAAAPPVPIDSDEDMSDAPSEAQSDS